MTSSEAESKTTWTGEVTSYYDEGPLDVEFKLFLDGAHWMAGWNRRGRTTQPPSSMSFDDTNLIWET
jgi:hypothetical protein